MQKKKLIIIFTILTILLLAGCQEENKEKTYISSEKDDAGAFILTDNTKTRYGRINSNNSDQPLICGLWTSGGGKNLTCRIIYRFNLSHWKKTDATFNTKCEHQAGNPGKVEIYLINDTGKIQNSPALENITNTWKLPQKGIRIGTKTPEENKWMKIKISKENIETKISENKYLSIMLKIKNESKNVNNDFWGFTSYEYTPKDQSDIPYIKT